MTTQMQTQTDVPETLGPYALVREIGRGGMSVVHQAVDQRTGKTVALKAHYIPPSLSSVERHEVLARFAREARAMGRLFHPGIVRIHEVGEQDGTHFLAMEFLDGETLRERLAHGPLTPAQAGPILAQIADAVDAVHAAGIIHRDVKPGNVMLRLNGAATLLDFGVARQSEDTTVTATHKIVGSPTYMAPEQVRGELGGPESDIWALGVLLYEMLAGHPPFQAASIPSVLFKVIHETPPPVPHVGTAVQQVLRRALEKDPQRRYPSARALANAVLGATQTSPKSAWTDALRRTAPWAVLLVLGGLLTGVMVTRLRHAPPDVRHVTVQPSESSRQTLALPITAAPVPRARAVPRRHQHRMVLSHTLRTHLRGTSADHRRKKPVRPDPPNIARSWRERPYHVSPKITLPFHPHAHVLTPRAWPSPRPASPRPERETRPYAQALRPRLETRPALPRLRRVWPPRRVQPPGDDKAAEQQRLQNLEKYIWSDGR